MTGREADGFEGEAMALSRSEWKLDMAALKAARLSGESSAICAERWSGVLGRGRGG